MTASTAELPSQSDREATHVLSLRLLPVLLGALVFATGAFIIEGYVVGVAHDDGMYVILGKALATGHGYRWLHIPGTPAATHFPPGYPAILAILWLIFPDFPGNVAAFQLANALFMAAAAIGVFYFARSRFGMSDLGSAILAMAATIGIPTLTLSVLVMSEPMFLALLFPILLMAERLLDAESRNSRDLVLLGLAVGAATLVRTHGIALIGGVALAFVLRRQLHAAALFTCSTLATLIPWQLWVSTHSGAVPSTMQGNYESYGAWLAQGLRTEGFGLVRRTLVRTTGNLTQMFGVLVAPSMPALVRGAALVLLLVLGTLGVRTLWRRAPVTALFLALYSTIVLMWPFWPVRFFWGIWPLIVLLPLLGVRAVLEWRPATRWLGAARAGALASGLLLAVGYAAYNVNGYRRQYWASIPRKISDEVRPMLVWVGTRTPRNALLATEAETSVYLYAGRMAVPVSTFTVDEFFTPRTPLENAAVIDTVITRYRPRAVVVSSGSMRDAVRELASTRPPTLVVVDTFPGGGLVLLPRAR